MAFLRSLVFVFTALFVGPTSAQETVHRDDLLQLFSDQSATGTFVLFDATTGTTTLVGAERAQERFIPASTFKIFNSLIALETGAVAHENEVVPFGGQPQRIKAWEQDMSIRDAIRVSNLPVYQQIARRVGPQRYATELARLNFGNEEVGDQVDTFWLKGPLKISAVEYVDLLARLAESDLPADARNQAIVQRITRLEAQEGAVLHGKTGWTTTPNPDIGWFVGWVDRDGAIFSFALNIDMTGRRDAAKRVPLAKAFLAALNVY